MRRSVLLLLLLLISPARAGIFDMHVDVPQDTKTFQVIGAYSDSDYASREIIASATVGAGWYVWDNLSLSLELGGYHVTQDGPDTNALSLGLMVRHHVLSLGDRASLLVDVGFSGFWGEEKVPANATNWGYIFRTGLGIAWEFRDGVYLIGGAHYLHISNAALESPARNPSINGAECYIGVMFTF
jgi:hypothetical protein